MLRAFLDALEQLFRWAALLFLAVIVVAMTLQVFGRYFLERGIPYTDEIAQISLSWLTFVGVPWVYRCGRHIAIELIFASNRTLIARVVGSLVHLLVAAAMVTLIKIGWQSAPLAMRIYPGTLGLSRFMSLFLPLMIGAGATIIFALEAAIRIWTAPRETGAGMGAS